jgi:ATP-dependent Clp protease ATP-binding subunit ClpB
MQLEIEREALARRRTRRAPSGSTPSRGDGRRSATRSTRCARGTSARRSDPGGPRAKEQIESSGTSSSGPSARLRPRAGAAAEARDIPRLEEQLARRARQLERPRRNGQLLREEVTDEEIAQIVSKWTGIPVSRLVEGEREKLLHLDDVLHERVIGQDEAVGPWPTP